MTTMTAPESAGVLDRKVAAEIRAEAARQGLSQKQLARRMEVPELWVSRRLRPSVCYNGTCGPDARSTRGSQLLAEDHTRMRATSDRHPDETLGERTVHLLLFAILVALAVLALIYLIGHASELLVEVERRVIPGPPPAPRSHAPVVLP